MNFAEQLLTDMRESGKRSAELFTELKAETEQWLGALQASAPSQDHPQFRASERVSTWKKMPIP